MVTPGRLTLARRRRKLTKKGLAEAAGFDQKTINRYENGEVDPPPESLVALSRILGFPEGFFYGPDIDEPSTEAISFRSLKALLARDRDAALAGSAFALLLSDWVSNQFFLPATDLIDFKEDTDPETAALYLRQKWKLGERRVRNMVHLLEAKGVRVFSLTENTRTLDAFSMWRTETPFVFLNTTMTAERSRFDAAHELGHLILHRHGGPGGRGSEDQANQFASAFLMPAAGVKAELPRIKYLNEIIQAKKLWGVSASALNYRLHKLGITTDWQYRRFCIQIWENFGQSEPFGMPREQSLLWKKIFSSLKSDHITKHSIANNLKLPVAEIENQLFGLINMQSIDGRGMGQGKGRAKLSLVTN
jgi:Zn-dependent peptidase ImmA (M78 family)/DNA-binding XRE family transcriptional regulator